MSSAKVALTRGTVHYTDLGQGEPLVLLHANPGDSQDYAAVMPTLARHYRVLALDWPGYGQSAMPPSPATTTVLSYYQVLGDFLAKLALPPAFFIGNSVGGNAAARLAAAHPEAVRGLVLVAPGGFTPHNFVSRAFCALQGSRFALSPYRFARLYLRCRTEVTAAMLQRAATSQASAQHLALNRALWRNFGTPDNDLRETAKHIRSPTLLLFGERDPAIQAKKDGRVAARTIPGARLVTLPCGHASFAEVPELFLAEVLPFLSSAARAGKPG